MCLFVWGGCWWLFGWVWCRYIFLDWGSWRIFFWFCWWSILLVLLIGCICWIVLFYFCLLGVSVSRLFGWYFVVIVCWWSRLMWFYLVIGWWLWLVWCCDGVVVYLVWFGLWRWWFGWFWCCSFVCCLGLVLVLSSLVCFGLGCWFFWFMLWIFCCVGIGFCLFCDVGCWIWWVFRLGWWLLVCWCWICLVFVCLWWLCVGFWWFCCGCGLILLCGNGCGCVVIMICWLILVRRFGFLGFVFSLLIWWLLFFCGMLEMLILLMGLMVL